MKDYQKHLDKYIDFPKHRKQAEKYLEKYWLDKKELNDTWVNIKNRVFNKEFRYSLDTGAWAKIRNRVFNKSFHFLPDQVINPDFGLIISKGGLVLYDKEFENLQYCMKFLGEKYFIILEDYDENNPPHDSGPSYRLKFPVNITWEEMTAGGDPYNLAYDVFMVPVRNYFVFGDSGKWGRYAANDYEWPLDIFGFDKQYSDLFHSRFKIPEEDIQDLKEWTAFYKIKLPGVD